MLFRSYTLLRARKGGYSNPSVKWGHIKNHAKAILAEEAKAKAKAEALARGEIVVETETEGGAKHNRSTQATLVQDLTTLYKHCKRNSKTLTDAQRKAQLHIGAALTDLGTNISML